MQRVVVSGDIVKLLWADGDGLCLFAKWCASGRVLPDPHEVLVPSIPQLNPRELNMRRVGEGLQLHKQHEGAQNEEC